MHTPIEAHARTQTERTPAESTDGHTVIDTNRQTHCDTQACAALSFFL